jgi:DoxX-like protein
MANPLLWLEAMAGLKATYGLVPKLLFNNSDERTLLAASHLPSTFVLAVGLVEIAISAYTILSWRSRWFFLLNICAMLLALLNVALASPSYLAAAFNPVTLNLGMIALSITPGIRLVADLVLGQI